VAAATLVPRSWIFLPWRWRRYVPPKRRFTLDIHGATSQKTAFFKFTAVKISNLTDLDFFWDSAVARLRNDLNICTLCIWTCTAYRYRSLCSDYTTVQATEESWFHSRQGWVIFLNFKASESHCSMGLGVKFPGSKADETWRWPLLFNTEVKNLRSYTASLSYIFVTWLIRYSYYS
jgi:hypothetical protein